MSRSSGYPLVPEGSPWQAIPHSGMMAPFLRNSARWPHPSPTLSHLAMDSGDSVVRSRVGGRW